MHDQHGATAAQPNQRDDDAQTFDVAPVSLWLHDYSAVKALFADWKAAGIADLREFLREDPSRPFRALPRHQSQPADAHAV
jgi:hypothetical protein